MNRTNLLIGIGAVLLLFLCGLVYGGLDVLRGLFGLIFALILPGWAVTAAIFPEREFGSLERATLSMGFSIAILILTGLLMHLSPIGIQTGAWFVLLTGITLLAVMVAIIRTEPASISTRIHPFRLSLLQAGMIGLAVLMASLAILIARQPTPAAGFEGYTSLWIYPFEIENDAAIQVGVSSREFDEVAYRLELQRGRQVIAEVPEFILTPGEARAVVLRLDEGLLDTDIPIQALLYRLDDQEQVYRQVRWWPKVGSD